VDCFGAWLFEGTISETIEIRDKGDVVDTAAFQGVSTLLKASFSPASQLIRLGPRVFAETNIDQGNLPGCLKQADIEAFQNCQRLRTVPIPGNSQFEHIPRRAFQGCENLVSIDLQCAIYLSEGVFDRCNKLKSVKFIVVKIPEDTPAELLQEINKPRKRVLQLPLWKR
jgi:hypothetical protein